MRKRLLMIVPGLLLLGSAFLYFSCQSPTQAPVKSSTTKAADLVNAGVTAMKSKDYDTALNDFSQAVALDPTNGEAAIGYAALNIASVVTAPSLASTMTTNVGLSSYPSTMAAFFNPKTWITQQTDSTGAITAEYPAIQIQGQSGTTFADWESALVEYVMTHNTGFDFIPQTLDTALGSRVDTAITTIKNSLNDNMTFTVTWDMVYNSQPSSAVWPYNSSNQPMKIVVGKAELLVVASFLEDLRAMLHTAQVYSLALPLNEYWTDFGPNSTGTQNPSTKPFDTLFQLNTDAQTQLNDAKANMTASMSDLNEAFGEIISDRSGFSLSSDQSTSIFGSSVLPSATFSTFVTDLKIGQRGVQEVQSSLANNAMAYFPVSIPVGFDPSTDWPTSVVAGQSIGFNYGLAYSTPIALVGTSGLFELTSSGEPQFYGSAGGTAISSAGTLNGGSTDFSSDTALAYLKITDATMGGVIPVSDYSQVSLPPDVVLDTSSSPASLYIGVPEYYAWLSLSSAGATATFPSTFPYPSPVTSDGSIYWYFLHQLSMP